MPLKHRTTLESRPRRVARALGLVLCVSWVGCSATPLPEPPSFDAGRMSLVDEPTSRVRLTGEAGAITPGGELIRVTGPSARVQTTVASDGSFVVALEGARSDVVYLELVRMEGDLFVGAVMGAAGTSVAVADPGPDQDGDGSPDFVDCAPDDPSQGGDRCVMSCVTSMDCATTEDCVAGTCVESDVDGDGFGAADDCDDTEASVNPATPETCADGIDNDCNGLVDDGC